jgi:outer membrane protein, heavy metal efflux system
MRVSCLLIGLSGLAAPLRAQQPVTRGQAIAAALARGTRALVGGADTAAAAGLLHGARLYPNPSVSATYTEDVPHYHVIADLPLDLPWIRSARIGAAAGARDAARYGYAFERASIRFDVDTTYTRALAAIARARLSHGTAVDADSLLTMARLRRQVGDVSELDVRLAAVNAGQLENAAADDSVAALDAVLAVQLAMGLPAESVTIAPTDSLSPPLNVDVPSTEPLFPAVAAAEAGLRASEHALSLAHRSVFATPSLQFGIEKGDPTGPAGALPTVGLAFPLPLFNRNGGEAAQASAARDRARATLDAVRRETSASLARAQREFALARARLERDARLLAGADRVAAMSLQAYAEGAVALPGVLEAQRSAREALARYIDDVAAANDAAAAIRLLAGAGPP